jgi:NTE family protein
MMYGLVLEGGGAKGSYQIGACQAMQELGVEFGAVAGTSIGALNGA